MAGESSGLWNNLPSIIIVEILSFLKPRDRLRASLVCKGWRNHLFHPKLWRKITFRIDSCDNTPSYNQQGARFLAKSCGKFVREVVIKVNTLNPRDVQLCKEVLKVLTLNNNLRALSIKPLRSLLEWSSSNNTRLLNQYVESLSTIAKRARAIEHLSLGFIEEILDRTTPVLLPLLAEHQSSSLRSLHLATIKEVPGTYLTHTINASLFGSFERLESLSIDYDYVDDQLLEVLAMPPRKLKKLNVHVHKLERSAQRPSDAAWKQITECSPDLKVTLTLLHLEGGVGNLLSSEMPLVSFRAFFSSGFGTDAVASLTHINNQTLKSFALVDRLGDGHTPVTSFVNNPIDPLVMLAWRCKKLMYLTVLGYEVGADSIVAISRLRGGNLMKLAIPRCCIYSVPIMESENLRKDAAFEYLRKEVSYGMHMSWKPLAVNELPPAVRHPHAYADGAYLEELLEDQAW